VASLVIIVLLSVLARVTVLGMFAVVIGLFVAGLAYLSYRGWVDVRWAAMEDASRSTLTNASEQIAHALNTTATQFASHPSRLEHASMTTVQV